ncbi:hypothetical protein RS030_81311 [Cryptosporidium xiaoi]|uniref:J domain-containing protein n=1 Tax=Cryptosporidium xiaoi TaxID=659607 RepID=A0AAV9XT62_9CRYT
MINIFGKLQRFYKKTRKERYVNIVDSEEPILVSMSRLTFLELEIDLLTQLLYKEIKTILPQSILSGLKWSDISIEDLNKIETSINKKFQLKVSPIVEPLISILRGLLETHKKFYSGKVMPFYVKLKKEHANTTEQSKEFIYSLKNEKRTKWYSECRSTEKHFQNNFRAGTPRNFTRTNGNNLELPLNNRNLRFHNPLTPRNSHITDTNRLKSDKFYNFDSSATTPRDFGARNSNFGNDYTPRKNTKATATLRSLNNQNRNILAAKALLGLSVNLPTTEQEIRKAYLRAAMRWHPDKSNLGSNDKSHSCFTAIRNAMELLLNNISKEGEI